MTSDIAQKLARKSSQTSIKNKKQVRLRLVRIDVFSTMKLSFLLGVCLAIVGVVGSFLVWLILDFTGVFNQITNIFADVSTEGANTVSSFFTLAQVLGISLFFGVVNIVFITIIGSIFAFLYNLSVRITGGLSVGFTNN